MNCLNVNLQELPVRGHWGRRAVCEGLVLPTAYTGSSHMGTPPRMQNTSWSINVNNYQQWLSSTIVPCNCILQDNRERLAKLKNYIHLHTTANWKHILLFNLKTTTSVSRLFACMCPFAYVYVLMSTGKYLLFYLLQWRLLNGTLHRLLLDGLHHLLLQRDILEKTQILQWVTGTL